MLRSMTGFGRERVAFDEREILVEIRSRRVPPVPTAILTKS